MVKIVFSFEPRVLTTVMIAIEMPAAMSAYSIAVAPDSFFKKADMRFFIANPFVPRWGHTWLPLKETYGAHIVTPQLQH